MRNVGVSERGASRIIAESRGLVDSADAARRSFVNDPTMMIRGREEEVEEVG